MSQHHDFNQPQITQQSNAHIKHQKQQEHNQNEHQSQHQHCQQNQNQQQKLLHNISIPNIHEKHPDCIPVFFVKHESLPKQFPSPVTPLQSYQLQSAQYSIQKITENITSNIKVKGLYFFCLKYVEENNEINKGINKDKNKNTNKENQQQDKKATTKRLKYIIINPQEQTIQQIYYKYGHQGYLTLIYGDKNIGMSGINKMQKWLIRILILLILVWVGLFTYPYILIFQYGGWEAVKLSISKIGQQQLVGQTNLNKFNNIQEMTIKGKDSSQQRNFDIQNEINSEQFINLHNSDIDNDNNEPSIQSVWDQVKIDIDNNYDQF